MIRNIFNSLFTFTSTVLTVLCIVSIVTAEENLHPLDYDRQMDVVYGYKDGMGFLLDVLTPKQNRNGAGIIIIHSGGLISNPTAYRGEGWQERKPVIAELLRKGYVLFITKHSSAPKYSLPEIRTDIPRAVRFIRHHAKRFGIDEERIGATGGSSGGTLALLLATEAQVPEPERPDEIDLESSQVQAVVAYFPVTDMIMFGLRPNPGRLNGRRTGSLEDRLLSNHTCESKYFTNIIITWRRRQSTHSTFPNFS